MFWDEASVHKFVQACCLIVEFVWCGCRPRDCFGGTTPQLNCLINQFAWAARHCHWQVSCCCFQTTDQQSILCSNGAIAALAPLLHSNIYRVQYTLAVHPRPQPFAVTSLTICFCYSSPWLCIHVCVYILIVQGKTAVFGANEPLSPFSTDKSNEQSECQQQTYISHFRLIGRGAFCKGFLFSMQKIEVNFVSGSNANTEMFLSYVSQKPTSVSGCCNRYAICWLHTQRRTQR